jgi:hypothetical protein
MGYTGQSPKALLPNRKVTERILRDMTDDGAEFMARRARAHTPVDTGQTRAAWKQGRVVKRGATYTSTVKNKHPNAPRLEHGTAAHQISARGGALMFFDGSRPVFRREVMHPGTPAFHMLAKAGAETEAAFDVITRPALGAWAREVEAIMKART